MATNKNQHFVPRCYLRPFTLSENGRAINLFNIDRLKFIKGASVRSQCSGDYFYGTNPALEKAIQTVEGSYAEVLSQVCNPPYELSDLAKLVIRRFWLLQFLRTESASRRAVEMMSGMATYIGVDSHHFKLEVREAVQTAMKVYAEEMHIVDDLKICIIKNKSTIPFVTSDDPAVLTNQWFLRDPRKYPWGSGLGSAGVLTLLPLSPAFLALGYDPDVYAISHRKGYAEISHERDAKAFNEHQYLNCRSNIFVRDEEHSALVADGYVAISANRPSSKHVYHYAKLDESNDNYERYVVVEPDDWQANEKGLLHWQTVHARPSLWPRILKRRNKSAIFTDGSGVGYIRRYEAMRRGDRTFRKEPAWSK